MAVLGKPTWQETTGSLQLVRIRAFSLIATTHCILFFNACLCLSGCTGSQLQHGTVAAARKVLVAACGILVPRPRIEPTPSALGVRNLSHWTPGKSPQHSEFCQQFQ